MMYIGLIVIITIWLVCSTYVLDMLISVFKDLSEKWFLKCSYDEMFAAGSNLFTCFICFVVSLRPPFQLEVVDDLLEAGADPNLKDGKEGRTALSYAVENVLSEFKDYLLSNIISTLNCCSAIPRILSFNKLFISVMMN